MCQLVVQRKFLRVDPLKGCTQKEVHAYMAERDLLRNAALETPNLSACTVGEVMTQRPESVREDRPLAYALQRMMVGDHRHLPVVDTKRRAVGVISSEVSGIAGAGRADDTAQR